MRHFWTNSPPPLVNVVCERLLTEFTHTLSLSHQDFLILARDFRSYVIIILNCKIKEGRFSISQLDKILFKVELNELLTTCFGFTNLQSRFFSNFWTKSNFFDGETSLNKQTRCYLISDWPKKIMKIRNLGLVIHETIWWAAHNLLQNGD